MGAEINRWIDGKKERKRERVGLSVWLLKLMMDLCGQFAKITTTTNIQIAMNGLHGNL